MRSSRRAPVTSTPSDSQRHLGPPKASEQMAEQDGKLDAAFGGTPAAMTAALRIALREEGTFLDEKIVDTATGQKSVAADDDRARAAGDRSYRPSAATGLPGGAYAFYPDATVVLPYLPDPLAIGVALTGYDYSGAVLFHQVALFDGAWPALQPFRLRLSEGALGVAFVDGVLEVRLPQSEVVRARLASVFPDDRLEDFGDLALDSRGCGHPSLEAGGDRRPALDADTVPVVDTYPRRPASARRARHDEGPVRARS